MTFHNQIVCNLIVFQSFVANSEHFYFIICFISLQQARSYTLRDSLDAEMNFNLTMQTTKFRSMNYECSLNRHYISSYQPSVTCFMMDCLVSFLLFLIHGLEVLCFLALKFLVFNLIIIYLVVVPFYFILWNLCILLFQSNLLYIFLVL